MLTDAALDLRSTTMQWAMAWWDRERHLVWNPPASLDEHLPERSVHLVPQSAWLAYALLGADDPAERDEGTRAIDALLALQYDEPGTAYHGTFAIIAEAAHPPTEPTMWVDYDPNWRQFIGTTFALVLEDFGDALAPELVTRIEHAIDLAVWGEPDGRIPPSYANPALMRSWLDAWWGVRSEHPQLVERGERFARVMAATFRAHNAFEEFNSPTYYGVDLFALALWATFPPTPAFDGESAEIIQALWGSAAVTYNAHLRNWCGPYTRSYHPDATRSVTLLGLWLWASIGRASAPVPAFDGRPIDHCHDLMAGAVIARLAPGVQHGFDPPSWTEPDPTTPIALAEARRVGAPFARGSQRLPGKRELDWVIARDLMVGIESSPSDWGGWTQPMLLTAHWRETDGAVGVLWLHGPRRLEGELNEQGTIVAFETTANDRAPIPATLRVRAPSCTRTEGGFTTPAMHVGVSGVVTELERLDGETFAVVVDRTAPGAPLALTFATRERPVLNSTP